MKVLKAGTRVRILNLGETLQVNKDYWASSRGREVKRLIDTYGGIVKQDHELIISYNKGCQGGINIPEEGLKNNLVGWIYLNRAKVEPWEKKNG